MAKLTKREKQLLVIMLLLLLGGGGFYLVYYPLSTQLVATQAELDFKDAEMYSVQRKIATKEDIEATNKETAKLLAQKQVLVRTYSYDEEVDTRMAELFESHSVGTQGVSVTASVGAEGTEEETGITYKSYSATLYGTQDNLLSIVDAIYEEPDMGIVLFSYSSTEGLGSTPAISYYNGLGYGVTHQAAIEVLIAMAVEEIPEVEAAE